MTSKFTSVLLNNETSDLVKSNVMVICQIAFLLVFIIVYNVAVGHYSNVFPDILIVLIAFTIWWLIKRKNLYFPNIVFCILLPLLSWSIFDAIVTWGIVGAFWCFPIVVLFYFCLPQRLAWIANAVVIATSLVTAILLLPPAATLRLTVALAMVVICCVTVFRNLYRQNKLLTDKAHKDELTGAYNRTLLQHSLESAISLNTRRTGDIFPCILCVDADHFKVINDTYGHHMGDAVLQDLASTLSKDFNHPKDKLFRMGGEEFLILKYLTSPNDTRAYAENIRANVAALSPFANGQSITVSIGVATIRDYLAQTQTNLKALSDDDALTQTISKQNLIKQWNRWIKQADDAMYQAKARGRNQVVFADQES